MVLQTRQGFEDIASFDVFRIVSIKKYQIKQREGVEILIQEVIKGDLACDGPCM